jgi:hypothetical protein
MLNTQFMEELMTESLDGTAKKKVVSGARFRYSHIPIHSRQSCSRGVLEEARDKGDRIGWSPWSEDLCEGVRLDLRELVFHVL